MSRDPRGERQLQAEISDYQIICLLADLQKERPDLVQRFFEDRDATSLAAGLREHNLQKAEALKPSAKPSKTGAKSSAKRGGWDKADINSKVRDILRSR
jgi:hypothetical protein